MPEPRQNGKCKFRGGHGWGRAVIAIVVVLGLGSAAPAVTFGDVEVTIEDGPRGPSSHGYAEVWARVANKSKTSHVVRLTLTDLGFGISDRIRDVSRTISVEPAKVSRVALAFPERLMNAGDGLSVSIDGSIQKTKLPLPATPSMGMAGRYGGAPPPLVLYSKTVDTRFPDWVTRTVFFGGTIRTTECVRAGLPAAEWSTNWLGYTRYDGVALTADDLRQMPAEVKAAIAQYVECGGSLFVMGAAPPLPASWKPGPILRSQIQIAAEAAQPGPPPGPGGLPEPVPAFPGIVPKMEVAPEPAPRFVPPREVEQGVLPHVSRCLVGFGQCLVTDQTNLSSWDFLQIQALMNSWTQTLQPWQTNRILEDNNRAFPVIDDLGVPVFGMLLLMFIFSFIIGPLNLYVLHRFKRKLWFFWTVPLMSFITCVAVFGYTVLREGWEGRSRVEGVTILDENSRRASTIGWSAFYTPLLSGGLHFSPDTEVTSLNADDAMMSPHGYRPRGGSNALTVDWTQDQHLASGWLTPRVPAHFAIRKGESRRERITIGRGASGLPEAVNGLGADITELWYCDEKDKMFHAENIPAGGRTTLEPATRPASAIGPRTLRSLYTGDWKDLVKRMQTDGSSYLRPRTYMAVLGSAPFLDDGLNKRATKKAQSIVFGILKEGGDEG